MYTNVSSDWLPIVSFDVKVYHRMRGAKCLDQELYKQEGISCDFTDFPDNQVFETKKDKRMSKGFLLVLGDSYGDFIP